jgi:hypothetical protein
LRYRHPIDPVLTLFAVYAASQIISTLASTRRTAARLPDVRDP